MKQHKIPITPKPQLRVESNFQEKQKTEFIIAAYKNNPSKS